MKRVYKPNLVPNYLGGDHSSRPFVTKWLKRPTRKRIMERAAPFVSLFGLAPRGVYLAGVCYQSPPVSSYLTVSPITPARKRRLVYSLLHLSSPLEKGARELPGPLPYGVRTFLFRQVESDRPTRFIARLSDYSKDVQQSKND